MILVVGSTGMVGGEVCRLLSEKGMPFRAMVRPTSDPVKVEGLKRLDAEIVEGDLRQPETLKTACAGVDAVICTVSALPFGYQPGVNDIHNVDMEGGKALVDAAKAAKVKHFIYTSFSKNMDLDFPLNNAKRAVENHILASDMVHTLLRPSYFMQVWLSPAVGFDAANRKAAIYGTGDQPISWIDYKDVARFAVAALTNPAACNAILELGGPETVSPNLVVQCYEVKLGSPIEVTHVPAEALLGQMQSAEDPMQRSFAGLMLAYASGDPIPMDAVLQAFQLKLTTVDEFISGG
jgi:uncharacterized protein YbjT (DUF2867 family)